MKQGFRYRQAHEEESDWWTVALVIFVILVIASVVVWGVPSGLPS